MNQVLICNFKLKEKKTKTIFFYNCIILKVLDQDQNRNREEAEAAAEVQLQIILVMMMHPKVVLIEHRKQCY